MMRFSLSGRIRRLLVQACTLELARRAARIEAHASLGRACLLGMRALDRLAAVLGCACAPGRHVLDQLGDGARCVERLALAADVVCLHAGMGMTHCT